MIWESCDWKEPLIEISDEIKSWESTALTEKDLVMIEKSILIGFYSIRKLIDACKLSDSTREIQIDIFSYPNIKNVHLMNWDRIDELYDLNDENREKRYLSFLYNQLIHSYVFMIEKNKEDGFGGVFFTSDTNRNKRLYKISSSKLIDIFQTIGNDYPHSMQMQFNEEKQDYEVKST